MEWPSINQLQFQNSDTSTDKELRRSYLCNFSNISTASFALPWCNLYATFSLISVRTSDWRIVCWKIKNFHVVRTKRSAARSWILVHKPWTPLVVERSARDCNGVSRVFYLGRTLRLDSFSLHTVAFIKNRKGCHDRGRWTTQEYSSLLTLFFCANSTASSRTATAALTSPRWEYIVTREDTLL